MLTRVSKSDSFCRALAIQLLSGEAMPKKSKALPATDSEPSKKTATSARTKVHGKKLLSNHKPRGHWFQSRSAWPKREAPVHTLVAERQRVARSLPPAMQNGAQWECVGPTNIGGRITSLICHPTRPEEIWIGAA